MLVREVYDNRKFKRKQKYYTYYRCQTHYEKNYPGGILQEKMAELISLMSLSPALALVSEAQNLPPSNS